MSRVSRSRSRRRNRSQIWSQIWSERVCEPTPLSTARELQQKRFNKNIFCFTSTTPITAVSPHDPEIPVIPFAATVLFLLFVHVPSSVLVLDLAEYSHSHDLALAIPTYSIESSARAVYQGDNWIRGTGMSERGRGRDLSRGRERRQ